MADPGPVADPGHVADPGCPLCDGRCAGARLDALAHPDLDWLWQAVADAGDRRGDPDLVDGSRVVVTVPADPGARAAAAGVFSGRPLQPGQVRRLDLAALAEVVRRWGPGLTPGAVAAHATDRRLAVRAHARSARSARRESLRAGFVDVCDTDELLRGQGAVLFDQLRSSGWVTRLDRVEQPAGLLRRAAQVAGQVCRIPPGERRDRRRLVPEDPHALDEGTVLAGLVLTLLAGLGRIPPGARSPRVAWARAGVDVDEVLGGLATLGVQPRGWSVPAGAVCTLPPRELLRADWPSPPSDHHEVFVTENPSVLTAAADIVGHDPGELDGAARIRLMCTMGTPSRTEIAALARLAGRGWQVRVRADFDPAGIRHVAALLAGVPGARPWRMGTSDYLGGLWGPGPGSGWAGVASLDTPWDPDLGRTMIDQATPVHEEALLPRLLADLAAGTRTDVPERG